MEMADLMSGITNRYILPASLSQLSAFFLLKTKLGKKNSLEHMGIYNIITTRLYLYT